MTRTGQQVLPETDSEGDSPPAPRNRVNRAMVIGFTIVLLSVIAVVVWLGSVREPLHVRDTPSPIVLATECDANPTGRELKAFAPACVEACPHVCHELNATIHRIKEGASLPGEACHGPMAPALACVVDAAHADACAPVLDQAERLGAPLPRKKNVLDAACSHGSTAGGAETESMPAKVESALWARALKEQYGEKPKFDLGVAGKHYDERCQGKGDGNTCISFEPGRYIYCSVNKRLSSPSIGWSCADKVGPKSRCLSKKMDHVLDLKGRIRCDDPFCRNGGATHGDGKYCHKDDVVRCTGDEEPKVVEKCSDQISYFGTNMSCFKKSIYTCVADGEAPSCKHVKDVWVDPFQLCSWQVTGPCAVDPNDRFCIQSPNFPGNYGNNERCDILIPNMPISLEHFHTKANDKMVFGQYNLSGNLESGQVMKFQPGARIFWTSDSQHTAKGWKLCAQAPTSPYSVNV